MSRSINVSVVVPLYNKEKHIQRAIKSVLAQTYQAFELIIVDDGSTDDSFEAVSDITDPRIRIVRQENRGVSVTRNRGISESKSDWIAFLDADDEWLPGKLELQISLLDNYQADFTSCNYINIDEQTREIETIKNFSPSGVIPSGILLFGSQIDELFLKNQSFITIPSVVCRKDLFQKFGDFNVDLRNAEDKELYWRFILANTKFVFSDQVLYYRHKLDQSLEDYSLVYRENQIKSLDVMYQDALQYGRVEFDKIFSDRLKLLLKRYLNQCHLERKPILISVKSILKQYKIIRKHPSILCGNLVRDFKQSFSRSLSSKRRS